MSLPGPAHEPARSTTEPTGATSTRSDTPDSAPNMPSRNARLYFLVCRTPLHIGCGDALGAIDKPTKRHVVTTHPQVPGSALKGCLKGPAVSAWQLGSEPLGEKRAEALFGGTSATGMLSPQDAALLLMPVACWAGGWAWVTSPAVLHRLRRAAVAADLADPPPQAMPNPPALQTALTPDKSLLVTKHEGVEAVVLAEEQLDWKPDDFVAEWAEWLARNAMAGEPADWCEDFKCRLAVVHDEVFDWLATVGTDVRARNRIEDDGVAADHHLWREECVPEDAVFYGVLCAQPVPGHRAMISERQALEAPVACELQLGGKGSVGYGWVSFRPAALPLAPQA